MQDTFTLARACVRTRTHAHSHSLLSGAAMSEPGAYECDREGDVLEHSGGDGALPVVDVLSSQHEHGSGSPF